MIHLALWEPQAEAGLTDLFGSPRPSLLGNGIWCPMRPGAATSIVDKPPSEKFDGTLFAVYFGGPGGKYLPNMTKLVVGLTSGGMQFLEVQYNVTVQPLWSTIVGRGPPPADMIVAELPIDGPGGERITSMIWRVADPGTGLGTSLYSLRVCTENENLPLAFWRVELQVFS